MILIIYFCDRLSYAIKNVVIILIRWNGCFTLVSKVVVLSTAHLRRQHQRASTCSGLEQVAAPAVGVVCRGLDL